MATIAIYTKDKYIHYSMLYVFNAHFMLKSALKQCITFIEVMLKFQAIN